MRVLPNTASPRGQQAHEALCGERGEQAETGVREHFRLRRDVERALAVDRAAAYDCARHGCRERGRRDRRHDHTRARRCR